jgi:hypothetical protein
MAKGLDYQAYKAKLKSFLENTNPASLDEHDRELYRYTVLNQQRISRVEKTYAPSGALLDTVQSITVPQYWMLLSALWCGDSAANLPVIAKIAQLNPMIQLSIIERDENLEIMDQYLTNGARSIPKLVVFNASGEELFTWGSRPASAKALVLEQKGQGIPQEVWEEKLHLWYARNRGQELEAELLAQLTAVLV